eukprot:TRINITY_DN5354_c0_g1_i13.p1 TRINITY_DN5354_c0_g1~~TRINITY_DN5354_c0_g1_i13.p1  ORF type:complete len:517 (+),score=100.00 TRINITY_DN5354_c0_g1_i13:51-1601(+)
MRSSTVATALFASLILSVAFAITDLASDKSVEPRFEYKFSFKAPFYMARSASIPFWDFGGSALVTEDYIRLTPDIQSRSGWLWNKRPSYMDEWETILRFHIHGNVRVGADGIAFWYTKEARKFGNTFGNEDNFVGLGLFFDTYDNDGRGDHPAIMALVNDGTQTYHIHSDGATQSVGRCLATLRNSLSPLQARIRYQGKSLTVDLSYESPDTEWNNCFVAKNIDLPTGYFFGITAATGGYSDKHDIYSMQTTDLKPISYTELLQRLRDNPAQLNNPPAGSSGENDAPSNAVSGAISEPEVAKEIQQELPIESSEVVKSPGSGDNVEQGVPPQVPQTGNQNLVTVKCAAQEIKGLEEIVQRRFEVLNALLHEQSKTAEAGRNDISKEIDSIHRQNGALSKLIEKQNDTLHELEKALKNVEDVLQGYRERVVGALGQQDKNAENMKSSLEDLSRMVLQLRDIVSSTGSKHETLVRNIATDLRQSVDSGSSSIQISMVVLFFVLLGVIYYTWFHKKPYF